VDRPKYDREVPVYTVESVMDRISATRPDLVVVGNLHNAAAEPMLLNFLSERFPTLVVMHDFWILTGRCAYTGGCEKYLTGCDDTCPTADEYPALPPAEIADAWKKKRLLLQAEKRPALLANSEWVASVARETMGKSSEGAPSIERVHLSFPLDVFRPRDRRDCREQFGLPQNAFIVLLPASLQDSRKGGRKFLAALERLGLPNLLVVALGPTTDGIETTVQVRQLGFVTDPYQIARLNSAADVVVVASSAETFGQVCIESIACGTPAVAFPVTGVREALRDGVTGVLAADTEPASLAAAVQHLYNRPDLRRDISRWGRLYVENEWSEFSAYRHFFLALCANGLADSLGLRRHLSFLPGEPAATPLQSVWQSKSRWIPRRGFSWQSEAAEYGLTAFWWAHGPSALAELFADTAGRHHVLISYRNPNPGHRLTLRCNGVVRGVYELPQTGAAAGRLLVLDTRLESGSNLMHFEFSDRFSKAENPESGNIMITEILVEAAAPSVRDFCYGDRSSERVLNGVWGNAEC
jgi:glycosyltransferase involved in cell wall biosynthesis